MVDGVYAFEGWNLHDKGIYEDLDFIFVLKNPPTSKFKLYSRDFDVSSKNTVKNSMITKKRDSVYSKIRDDFFTI